MAISILVDSETRQTSVRFSVGDEAPTSEISVVGSFNDWSTGVDTLQAQDDGTRAVTVVVPSGQDVHFRYLAENGIWFDDPDSDEVTEQGSIVRLEAASSAPDQSSDPTPSAPEAVTTVDDGTSSPA